MSTMLRRLFLLSLFALGGCVLYSDGLARGGDDPSLSGDAFGAIDAPSTNGWNTDAGLVFVDGSPDAGSSLVDGIPDAGSSRDSSPPEAGPLANCVGPDGSEIPHGASARYFAAKVHPDCATQGQERVCYDGQLSGSYQYGTCVRLPSGCVGPDGADIAHGAERSYFQSGLHEDCASVRETRLCTDGVLSGSFTHAACCINDTGSACEVTFQQETPGCRGDHGCAQFWAVYYNSPNGCDPATAGSKVEQEGPACTYVGFSAGDPFHSIADGSCVNSSARGYSGTNTFTRVIPGTGCTHMASVSRPGVRQCDGSCQ